MSAEGLSMSDLRYDVFLSYNSKDRPAVAAIAHALRNEGLEPWLDQWRLTPGGDWQAELAAGMRASRSCAVFVGPHSIGAWSAMEVRLALDRVAKDPVFRCFPVLLPGVPEPFDPDLLPPFLGAFSWVNFSAGADDPAALQHLLGAIRGLPFGVAAPAAETSPVSRVAPPDAPPSPNVPAAACVPSGLPPVAPTPSNLPAAVTSFIGREQEQAELTALLEGDIAAGGCRLLTLVGPGGCGKTRLALAVAKSVQSRFPDGVWLAGLAAIGDPALVPAEVAGVLSLREEQGRSVQAIIAEHVKSRTLLLVLDNCEHVIEAGARLTTALLVAAPQLRIIATSREPLGVAGEQTYRVPSLQTPEAIAPTAESIGGYPAVRLFVERGRAAKHDFVLTDQNAPPVAAICARLDGLPLALELAAARLSALAPEAIAARLSDRFKLLTGGPRTALPRQRTLRAALDWSYDLLSEPERLLMRSLSVFAGGCTLEAAETVCASASVESWAVLDLLTALVNKSLVQAVEVAEETRYRMLETVRQYSAERQDMAGEGPSPPNRLLAWCVALAQQAEPALRGPDQAHWLARLESELDNLRAALGWSMDDPERAHDGLALAGLLSDFWTVRGHFSEGRRWLEKGLAAVPASSDVRARAAAGKLAHSMGDYAAARGHYEAALAAQRQRGDEAGAADTLRQLGNVAKRQSHFDDAAAFYRQSLEICTALGDRWGTAAAHNSLGMVAGTNGDFAEAARQYADALEVFRAEQDHGTVASVLNNLGLLSREQGEFERATTLLTEALGILRALGDKPGTAATMNNLALVAFDEGDTARARAIYEESLAVSRAMGNKAMVAASCQNLAETLQAKGDYNEALPYFLEALALRESLGDNLGLAAVLEGVAKALAAGARHTATATLLGAASCLRHEMHAPLASSHRAMHEQLMAETKSALGSERFDAAWHAGRAMSAVEAAAHAREQMDLMGETSRGT